MYAYHSPWHYQLSLLSRQPGNQEFWRPTSHSKEKPLKLQETIRINNTILRLIESKYNDPPSCWPRTAEARYYRTLLNETQLAIDSLKHGGIALEPPESP